MAASVKHSPELLYVNRTGSNVLYKSGSAYQELMKPELNLGGSMQSVTAILSGVNQVDIFALDQKTRTYMYKQRQGNWWLPSQEEWMDLGGDFISKPATTVSAPGHVELIGLNSLNATIQLKSFKFNEDTEWKELPSGELQFIGHPIITSSGTVGKFDVWAIDSDGALHHMYFNGRGQYKKWENLGGEFSDTPDVVYNVQEDIIYIVGKDYKGTYHTKKYDGKQRQWLPSHNQWDTLIGPYSSQPGLLTTEEKGKLKAILPPLYPSLPGANRDVDTLFVFGVDEENMVKMQKGTPYGWWPNAHLTEHIGTLPDYIEQKLPAFFGSSEL